MLKQSENMVLEIKDQKRNKRNFLRQYSVYIPSWKYQHGFQMFSKNIEMEPWFRTADKHN